MHETHNTYTFFTSFYAAKNKTPKETQWCLILIVMSEGCPSVTLDEHKSVISISGVRVRLNKLSNSTSHKV